MDNSRRTFIEMGLATAGASLMSQANAAAREAPSEAGRERRTPILEAVYLVVYRPGENWLPGRPLQGQPLREHGRYMLSLYREGTLRYAGGFADDTGGAAVFSAPDAAAAERVISKDPAVVSKVFTYELHPWARVDWAKLLEGRPAADG
jgi:uncharacterized protein YciI